MTKHLTRLFALLACILASTHLIAQEFDMGFAVITPENVADLELGYAIPGWCDGYNSSGTYLYISNNGMYDLATGEQILKEGTLSADGNVLLNASGVYRYPSEELIFATEGVGNTFIRDERYVLSLFDGVYDFATGERIFQISAIARPSSTGEYLYVDEEGVYETSTGDLVMHDPVNRQSSYDYYRFSPDDRYFINELELTIFDLENREYILDIEPSEPTMSTAFSPDSRYLAVAGKGVYSLPDGEQVLVSEGNRTSFSPDGTLVAFNGDAVYEVDSWQEVITIEEGDGSPQFTADNQYLHIFSWGAYHIPTGDFFEIENRGSFTRLSPNGDLLIDVSNGIYDLETAEQRLTFDFAESFILGSVPTPFNASQTILARSYNNFTYTQGLYAMCLVYGVAGSDWAYRSGLVTTENAIPVYDAPNGEEITDISEILLVFSQTADGAWYRISPAGGINFDREFVPLWIRAEDVTPISMPEGIPIEDPNA
ncbi:MAG: hypothetical protein AAFV98_16560 [Chloroflexota bacterium]